MPIDCSSHPPFFIGNVYSTEVFGDKEWGVVGMYQESLTNFSERCKNCKEKALTCPENPVGELYPLGKITLSEVIITPKANDNDADFDMISSVILDICFGLETLPTPMVFLNVCMCTPQDIMKIDALNSAGVSKEKSLQNIRKITNGTMLSMILVHPHDSEMTKEYLHYCQRYWKAISDISKKEMALMPYFSTDFIPRKLYLRLGPAALRDVYQIPFRLPEVWQFKEKKDNTFYFDKLCTYEGKFSSPHSCNLGAEISEDLMQKLIKSKSVYMTL